MKTEISLIICSIFLINCADNSGSPDPSKFKHIGPGYESPKFHTAENEGRWIDMSPEHLPQISYSEDNTKIFVEVPLEPVQNPRHYIGVIALMKGEKEIETKRMNFTFEKAKAEFPMPDGDKSDYWIMVRCNLHDMWKQPLP